MQYNKEHTFDFMRAHRQDSKQTCSCNDAPRP